MTPIDTFTDILRARSSCRAFRPDPVDDAIITRIVDAARICRPPALAGALGRGVDWYA